MKKLLFIIFFYGFSFSASRLYAQQQEANIWYFGHYLGIDFNSGTAMPLNDGIIQTTEGVASISDANGNLLFYTDGLTIRNRLHQVMLNGSGLFGNVSSTQSAVIVPKIGDPSRYYVFTVDAQSGPNGLTYSVVNMTLDNGNGGVELKNAPLQLNVVEKVTAVRHCNNRDIWVLAHGSMSDIYYAFLVSPAGISTSPVISHSGAVLPGVVPPSSSDSSSLGYLKASPDGRRIAAAHFTVSADLSDFNNATGVVSNTINLFTPAKSDYYNAYGIEFSPNSQLVYTTVFYNNPGNNLPRNALLQYDLSLGSAAAIQASELVISQNSDPIQTYAALQVAPDGKMYMAKNTYKHIAAVNNPDVVGAGANFVSNAIAYTLPNQKSTFGLPTFVQSYFYPVDSFAYVVNCPGTSVNFTYNIPAHVNSIQWTFGDPLSGASNTSTITNPVHLFTAPGTYTVQLLKFTACGTDTIRRVINTQGINVNLGADTLVCGGSSVLLNPNGVGSTNSFIWQDGSTNPTFSATTPGLYWVEASNAMGCRFRDSINVNFKPMPSFNLGADKSICENQSALLDATYDVSTTYQWSTGATTATIGVTSAGLFWCETQREGCRFRDSINITVNALPVVNLGPDLTRCEGETVLLDATVPGASYLWMNGSTAPTLSTASSGLYWVELTNSNNCKKRDSINISFLPAPVFNLGADRSICSKDTLTLNATVSGATSYQWNNGATTSSIRAFAAGMYWCQVNIGTCFFRDSLIITAVNPSPVTDLGADITVCTGQPVTLDATSPNSTYQWQDGSSNATLSPASTGLYWVQVTNNFSCTIRDSIRVDFLNAPVFNLGADKSICAGDTLLLNASATGATSYQWNTGAVTPSIRAFAAGLYWCETSNGVCVYRDSMRILAVNPIPVVDLGPDVTRCEGQIVLLDATQPGASYLWQNGSGNPTFNVTQQGRYFVEVNLNGCKKSDSIFVQYNLKPVFTLGADQLICAGQPIHLNPVLDAGWELMWQDGSSLAQYSITQAGSYALTATNSCGSRTDELVVSNGLCQVYLPNAFTPNADGLNDIFRAAGTELVTSYNLRIFNRYSQVVFETADKARGWDGRLKGTASPMGAYVWILQFKTVSSPETVQLKGTVMLIR